MIGRAVADLERWFWRLGSGGFQLVQRNCPRNNPKPRANLDEAFGQAR